MSEQDNIDLQKLSQRELLILMHDRLNGVSDSVKKLTETQAKHEVRISLIDQRVMMWGALFGSISGIVVTIIIALIKG